MFERVYRHQLDAKNRMRIPAKFKEELGENCTVTLGVGGCLYVFTEEQMADYRAKLSKISPFDAKGQASVRKTISCTWDIVEDNQGRILIPEYIRKAVKIEKDVVVVKNLTHVEIWAAEVWDSYLSDIDFDDCVAEIMRVTADD